MGSSNSLSISSEPPELGNWFSSYAYESPALNSADDFKDSGYSVLAEIRDGKNERKEDFDEIGALEKGEVLLADEKDNSNGFLSRKSQARRDNNYASEAFEDSDSLSLFSEPLDVKNWFSSYVYESPVLDTCYEFGSHPIEHVIDEEENHAPNSGAQKEEESISITKAVELQDLKVENVSSDGLIKCTNSFGEKENHHHYFAKDSRKACRNKDLAVLNTLNPQCDSHQILDKKKMQDNGNGQAKDFEVSIINGGSSPSNFNAKIDTEASRLLLDVKSISVNKKQNLPPESFNDPTEQKHEAFAKSMDFISPSKKLYFDVVNRRTLNKALGGDDNKENDRNECAESRFISTRKSKQVDEDNCFRKPVKVGFTNPPRGNKDSTATSKVLLETTNFQAPNVLEITGKWRCPQKSKPNLGPPLKQLRLEKWVRRL